MRAALDSNTVEVGVFEQIEDVTMVILVTIYQYLCPLQAYCCNQNQPSDPVTAAEGTTTDDSAVSVKVQFSMTLCETNV
jgi:hypothetical protein